MAVTTIAPYKRFQGLSRKKIAELLALDEQAQHVIDHDGAEKLREEYRKFDLSLTSEAMLHYGTVAEKVGHWNVARQWYDEIKRAGGDSQLLRTLLVRCGWRKEAEKHFGRLTADEYRTIGNHHLHSRGWSDNNHFTEALYAFNAAEDAAGIHRIRECAVKLGDHKMAEQIAVQMNRPLTLREHERIGRALIKAHLGVSREALHYVHCHKLNRLAPECIARLIKDATSLRTLEHHARTLGVHLTLRQLEALFHAQRAQDVTPDETVRTARALARQSKRWQKRLRKLYAWARDNHLGYGHIKQADRYGRLCGRPVTVEEAMEVYTERSSESDQYLDWAREQRRDALELATARIAKAA